MRSENDNSDQNSLEVNITANNYYGGKILCRSKPSLDVEDAKKDSRLIAMFGQADVNTKMTALAQGYEDIDLPKKVKVLAVFVAVLAAIGVIMTLLGEASERLRQLLFKASRSPGSIHTTSLEDALSSASVYLTLPYLTFQTEIISREIHSY